MRILFGKSCAVQATKRGLPASFGRCFFSGLAVPHRAGLLSLVSRTSLYSSRFLLITDGPRRAVAAALRSAALVRMICGDG